MTAFSQNFILPASIPVPFDRGMSVRGGRGGHVRIVCLVGPTSS